MTKSALRNIYKKKRLEINEKDFAIFNDLLLIQFQTIELPFLQNILSYYPLERMNEPDTFLITRYLKFQNPQINIAYPQINEQQQLDPIIVNNDSEFRPNQYGIMEIQDGFKMVPQDIEMVIVPLLACNYKGYRVGYGKGYYDRFFQYCPKNVLKIGLSFFDPIDTIDDLQPFDVPLTHCVTTDLVYEF